MARMRRLSTPDNRLWASAVRLKADPLIWVRAGTDGCQGGACEEAGDEEGAFIDRRRGLFAGREA